MRDKSFPVDFFLENDFSHGQDIASALAHGLKFLLLSFSNRATFSPTMV